MPYVIGSLVFVVAAAMAFFFFRKKSTPSQESTENFTPILPSEYHENQTYATKNDGIGIKFYCTEGKQQGEVFGLPENKGIIGSDPSAQIVLQDNDVAAKHAEISLVDGKFIINALVGASAIYCGDQETRKAEISGGMTLGIGNTKLKVQVFQQ